MLGGISENAFGVYYNDNGIQMAKEILDIIGEMNKTTKDLYGYNANAEQIPSESCSIKICKKDKLVFGEDCVDTYIYGNQWIPLNQQCDVMERIRVSSILDKACGGGVMLHINLSEKFSDEEQAWRFMNKLAREGVVYFSFIMKINVCENDHSFYGNKCPICSGCVVDSYIKIVGYLVKTSSYKSERATEMNERVFYNL
jgi:ribonucleoside-triphosphate reductase